MDVKGITRRIKIYFFEGDIMEIKRTVIKRKIVLFWSCNNPKHNHKTEKAAQYCIDNAPKTTREEQQKAKTKRVKGIFEDLNNGMSRRDIAVNLGISYERVSELIRKEKRGW